MNKKYRPSNGEEGEWFQNRWCYRCERDAKYQRTMNGEDGCKILAATMLHCADDPEYPEEWTFDNEGHPICTAFVESGKPIPEPPDPNQLSLFGE